MISTRWCNRPTRSNVTIFIPCDYDPTRSELHDDSIRSTASRIGRRELAQQAQVDASTLLGTLNEGVKLELDKQGADWNTGKVYVSTQVAGASNGAVAALPGWDTINIRNAPSTDPSTDVGDLKQGQSLELISGPINGWLVARVYLSAQFSQVISDQPAPPPPPDGLDVPSGSPLTLAELQAMSLHLPAS